MVCDLVLYEFFLILVITILEAKVGSFTWENAYSKLQSPSVSPVSTGVQSDAATPVKASTEYKMFIKSLRNLVDV